MNIKHYNWYQSGQGRKIHTNRVRDEKSKKKWFLKHCVLTADSESTQKFMHNRTISSSGGAFCVELWLNKGRVLFVVFLVKISISKVDKQKLWFLNIVFWQQIRNLRKNSCITAPLARLEVLSASSYGWTKVEIECWSQCRILRVFKKDAPWSADHF